MNKQQKHSIATMLACNTLAGVLTRLDALDPTSFPVEEAKAWARQIDKHYGRRDGFIPRKVIALLHQ